MSLLSTLPCTVRQMNYLLRVYSRSAEIWYHRTWRHWNKDYLDALTSRQFEKVLSMQIPKAESSKVKRIKKEDDGKEDRLTHIKLRLRPHPFRVLRPDKWAKTQSSEFYNGDTKQEPSETSQSIHSDAPGEKVIPTPSDDKIARQNQKIIAKLKLRLGGLADNDEKQKRAQIKTEDTVFEEKSKRPRRGQRYEEDLTSSRNSFKTGYKRQAINCDQWDKSFSSRGALLKHTTSVHETDKKFCLECGFVSRNSFYIVDHFKHKHNDLFLTKRYSLTEFYESAGEDQEPTNLHNFGNNKTSSGRKKKHLPIIKEENDKDAQLKIFVLMIEEMLAESSENSTPVKMKKIYYFLVDIMLANSASEPFQVAPDLEEFPDYFEKITDHVDLSLVRTRIEKGYYSDPEKFISEIYQMFQNTVDYFTEQPIKAVLAKKLESEISPFVDQLKNIQIKSNKFKMSASKISLSSSGTLILRDQKLKKIPLHAIDDKPDWIYHLDLQNNWVMSLEQSWIFKLRNLKVLDLRNNRLDCVTPSISYLGHLEILQLDENSLSQLPNDICELSSLEVLTISKNSFFAVPEGVYKLRSLRRLALNNNQIRTLSKSLGNLVNLRQLFLHKNSFSDLPNSMYKLKNLNELSLEWFRHAVPPLPKYLSGQNGEEFITGLRNLWNKLFCRGTSHCNVLAFLRFFSTALFELDILANKQKGPIHIAVAEGDVGVVEGYLAGGVNINVLDKDEYSPLWLAIKNSNFHIAKLLLDAGANLDIGGGTLGGPLHISVYKGEIWLVRDLIKRNVDVNCKDSDGNTALHIVLSVFNKFKRKSKLIADMLLKAGSLVNDKNKNHWTPIHLASRRGQLEAIQWINETNTQLQIAGKEIFDINRTGGTQDWTALHLSANAGHYVVVRELIHAGADPLIPNQQGLLAKSLIKSDIVLFKLLNSVERLYMSRNNKKEEDVVIVRQESSDTQNFNTLVDPGVQLSKRYIALYALASSVNGFDFLKNATEFIEWKTLMDDLHTILAKYN